MPPFKVSVEVEAWPLKTAFVIARGAKTEARVVVVTLADGTLTGRGECVPYARYGETIESVIGQLDGASVLTDRAALASGMAPGAARNALDCALWDLECKRQGRPAAEIANCPLIQPVETCFTLSLASPAEMAAAARAVPHLKLLKLKLGGDGDPERMAAVRQARPDARIVADANEAWTPRMLVPHLKSAAEAGIELIEQPLPAGSDAILAEIDHPVAICADESAHTSADLDRISDLYEAVNIKLDKAGGLTEALTMARGAQDLGLDIMAGCMVATSLAMAPALLIAGYARWVDLDGPLLLASDRPGGLVIENGIITPPSKELWG